jgi:hypothetical protein
MLGTGTETILYVGTYACTNVHGAVINHLSEVRSKQEKKHKNVSSRNKSFR